jgi:hypothetical protein
VIDYEDFLLIALLFELESESFPDCRVYGRCIRISGGEWRIRPAAICLSGANVRSIS